MTIKRETLEKLVADDEFGLSTVAPKAAVQTPDDRLLASFMEIAEFFESRGHSPRDPETSDVDPIESKLFWRLEGIRTSSEKSEKLRAHDAHGLLAGTEAPESIDDILGSPDLDDVIGDEGKEIFNLRNVPERIEQPEEVAEQKPCEDFEKFRPLFEDCHSQIRSGERKLIRFSGEGNIQLGAFYVLRGTLVYVAEVGEDTRDKRGKVYARTRTIFENGTESNILVRSLGRALLRGGQRVTESEAQTLERMGIDPDTPLGTLYVLRSLSDDPQLKQFPDLHKIGFTRQEVEVRIAGADTDSTFLGAGVEVVATYTMPAAMAPKVEGLLHRTFAEVRLDAVFERDGVEIASANEWFAVSLPVINEAIDLINGETISEFEFDPEAGRLRLRS